MVIVAQETTAPAKTQETLETLETLETQEIQEKSASGNRWRVKDIITLVVFNVIMLVLAMVLQMLVSVIITPAYSNMVGAAIFALFTAPFYVVMSYRINKTGVLLFSMLMFGLLFTIMGLVYYLPVMVLGGVIGELLMLGKGSYRKPLRVTIGYAWYYIVFGLCGTIPYLLYGESYITTMSAMYPPEFIATMTDHYTNPLTMLVMSLISCAGATLGCWIGNLLLKRHVKKAKLA
jgi:energy-coupling factor transport system substrate-specific component